MDRFLERRVLQPKADVADYVEQNGILVPRRFKTLTNGIDSGADLIVRSEHPDEYAGPSGLFDSRVIDEKRRGYAEEPDYESKYVSDWELTRRALRKRLFEGGTDHEYLTALKQAQLKMAKRYATHARLPLEVVTRDLSYSVWEHMAGVNCTVVADNTIPDRYHIFTQDKRNRGVKLGYFSVERGEVSFSSTINSSAEELPLAALIDQYERVRRLEAFDPNHCPAIELQSAEGQIFFLQYHRTRDFSPATFEITDEPVGWVKAGFARGATPESGLQRNLTLYDFSDKPFYDDAGFDLSADFVMEEVAVRRRDIQVMHVRDEGKLKSYLYGACEGHSNKSHMFKPCVSIMASMNDLGIPDDYSSPVDTETRQSIPLEVISDGRQAFVRFVG